MSPKQPEPPAGLGVAGRARWKELVDPAVEFRPDELVLIAEACHVVDTLASLRKGPPGDKTVGEIRLQQEQLRKLLGGVDWPQDQEANLSTWGRTMANKRWRA